MACKQHGVMQPCVIRLSEPQSKLLAWAIFNPQV